MEQSHDVEQPQPAPAPGPGAPARRPSFPKALGGLLAAPERLTLLALGTVLLLAAALRFYGLDWDDGYHLHPDERFITMVTQAVALPANPLDYFDTARSSLNPYNRGFDGFAYGTLPLFLTRAVGELLGKTSYDDVHLVGRALSGLADLGSVLFVFLLGRAVYGRRVGLVAAALLAVAVLNVQLAHFYAFDSFLAFFLTAALYWAYRAWYLGGVSSFLVLGLLFGSALACKVSGLVFLPVLVGAALLPHPALAGPDRSAEREPQPQPPRAAWWSGGLVRASNLAFALLAAALAFRVFEPYAFAGPTIFHVRPNVQFLADMDRWIKISSGEVDVPYTIQWAFTPPLLFSVQGIVLWGLGIPLGLAAFAGLVWAGWELLARPTAARHLLLVGWVVLNLAYFGSQFAKFLRYLLPIYPALVLLAAYLLVGLLAAAERQPAGAGRSGRWWRVGPRLLAAGLLGGALVATTLWALAFVNLYSRPVSRVTASDWIYANVPAGAVIAAEHWDDRLPLGRPGQDPGRYRYVELTLYDEDNPQKLRKLLDALSQADYLVLASNRLSGSITRVPERYPMASEYYRLLLGGELGFERVAVFQERPSLFGIAIDDSWAQEDFTVYDHPTVLVFRKTPAFSAAGLEERLGPLAQRGGLRFKAVDAPRNALRLTQAEAQAARAGGTWSTIFDRASFANQQPVLVWLGATYLLALAAFPLCWRVFGRLADRGYAVAKVLGLLLVSYLAWLAASVHLLPFTAGSLWAAVALLLLASGAVLVRDWPAVRAFVRANARALLATELAFLAVFLLFLGVRLANPDLWHPHFGGEKPMDFAYLNAVIKSDYFPPYDPWFAGGYINYYYYGFVLVAALVELTGIVPSVAFNLAIPLFAALTATAAFSFGFNWAAGRRGVRSERHLRLALLGGAAGATFVVLIGNLDGGLQLLEGLAKVGGDGQAPASPVALVARAFVGALAVLGGARLPEFDFWRSTRVIGPEDPGPISEFPYFTFLYGDLHAHLLALPLTVAALLLALELARRSEWRQGRLLPVLPHLALGGLLVGALRATNTWDFPTYLLVLLAAIGVALAPRRPEDLTPALVRLSVGGLALFGGALLLFYPYVQRYQLFYTGVDPVSAKTALGQFLTIHGHFLFLAGSLLALQAYAIWRPRARPSGALVPRPGSYYGVLAPSLAVEPPLAAHGIVLALAGALALALLLAGYTVPALLALLLGLAAVVALRNWAAPDRLLLALLAGLSFAIQAFPEFFTLKGDIGRMNTVFKFYLQVWVMLALVGAASLTLLLRRLSTSPDLRRWRAPWLAALALFLGVALLYPLLATPAKTRLRFNDPPGLTLDGAAFMATAVYHDQNRPIPLRPDFEAIRWLQEHVSGSPVVLEAQTPLYRWGSRVSIYTGLPTVIGWDWHQKQQRVEYGAEVEARSRDVRTIYETRSVDEALALLRKYGVEYVYVGPLEAAYYPAAGLEKFRALVGRGLEIVYDRDGVTIYRVAQR